MMWTTRPRSDFGDLKAIRQGSGPKMILLHGVGLQAEAWNAQIDFFSQSFEVIAPDMPGHGESSGNGITPTLSKYTARIAKAIDEPSIIMGHSMGSMIALDLACNHPEKVKSVIALNAIFGRSPEAINAVRERAKQMDGKTAPNPSGPLNRWFQDQSSDEARACKKWLKEVTPAAYKIAYSVFANENGPAPEALEQLHCPALFFTGEREPNSTPDMSNAMAQLAPQGQVKILKDAAHMMPMTHSDAVNQTLSTFLEEVVK